MSLITTCPSCGTSFRVTPEQLAAHRGDVRCGKCQHIFSALKQLEEVVPTSPLAIEETAEELLHIPTATSQPVESPSENIEPPLAMPAEEEPSTEVHIQPEQALELEPLDLAISPESEPELEPSLEVSSTSAVVETEFPALQESGIAEEREAESDEEHEIQALSIDTSALDFEIEPEIESESMVVVEEDSPATSTLVPDTEEIELRSLEAWPEESDVVEASAPGKPTEPEPQQDSTPPAAASAPTAETGTPVPSFMAPVQQRRRPIVTAMLALVSLLLLLLLAAQGIYFMRNMLAAHYPQSMPWLEQLCQPLHCKVELPHQAELLSIEDSDLQDDTEHDGVLILRSVLDNRATFTQALPLLELTLTDTGDLPVLRRTFTPREYLPKEMSPEKGIAAGAQIQIRLNLVTEGIKPAGYRLYVRY
ncbi:uncharacterized protein NMK_1500 [Novimethylophilus kurashikiensis]|uniref:Zinc finger/thioredoxin putative domain-containing protein n=1 Tax=Novimethylophilus kurashikiensis TaxID=1825523 RepID=A0A2R5F6X0_9PROT|nr:DUF3426 domain-containing protein [Novimethylophilus kurashikiensis]GBG13947.1 uncharacterized protein NMK_1500 [Novimethylophilus kurashikiensis]